MMDPVTDEVFTSDDGRFRVVLTSAVVAKMLVHCRNAGDRETGGVIAGQYTDDYSCAVATHVAGPTGDSTAGYTWFHRGIRGLERWLHGLWEQKVAFYLGEWHYHPRASADPSCMDRTQLRLIAVSRRYHCPEPALVIVGGDPNGCWTISVTVFTRALRSYSLRRVRE